MEADEQFDGDTRGKEVTIQICFSCKRIIMGAEQFDGDTRQTGIYMVKTLPLTLLKKH